MTDKKWKQLVYQIEEKFGIEQREQEEFVVDQTNQGQEIKGTKDIVIFSGPLGRTKLEKISRPRIVDKKILSSKRIGGQVATDYIYSPEETVNEFKAYREEEEKWQEINAQALGLGED